MILATSRINYSGEGRLDITVKSGEGLGVLLAPTYEMVGGVKHWLHLNGESQRGDWFLKYPALSTEQYTELYTHEMRQRYRLRQSDFMQIINMDRVVLCCYCAKGHFCHRHLAADILAKTAVHHGITCTRIGEIE